MTNHGMADGMADELMSRREYRTGSVYQRASDGRWLGTLEAGFTASGTRRRITVTGKTKAEVLRKLRDKRLAMERDGRAGTRRTITVAKWSTDWLSDIATKVRPAAYETDKAAMRWVVSTIGATKLTDLTPADVRAVAKAIRSAGLSSSTALRYHGSLLRMLKAASLEGYNLAPNVLLAENPKKAVHDRQAISTEQVAALLPHITSRVDGSRWSLALLQGLRQAEALGLTWRDVDLHAGSLTIQWQAKSLRYRDRARPELGFVMPDGYEVRHLVGSVHLVRPKSNAGRRVIPLVPWATNALAQWRESAPENPHGLVWPGRRAKEGWPRNPAGDRAQWEAIQEAAGVAHPSGRPYLVHEIRNTTATVLMELGVPESVRIAIMGHSSIAVTKGYEYADLSQMRAALEQAAVRLRLD